MKKKQVLMLFRTASVSLASTSASETLAVRKSM